MNTTTSDVRPVLRVGSLAYFDAHITGLIPCKVLSIRGTSGPASSEQNVSVRLTATRGAYKRGEVLASWALHVIPRAALMRRKYGARIGYYTVEVPK